MVSKKKQKKSATEESVRKGAIEYLQGKISKVDAQIQKLSGVRVPPVTQVSDRNVVSDYYSSFVGRDSVPRMLKLYDEARDDITPETLQTILEIPKKTMLRGNQEDKELYLKAIKGLETSKNPTRDFANLQKYLQRLKEYRELGSGSAHSYCTMGEDDSPPREPKVLRGE